MERTYDVGADPPNSRFTFFDGAHPDVLSVAAPVDYNIHAPQT